MPTSGNLIGRHLSDETGSFEIVGVIGDVRGTAGSIANKVGAEVYFPADGGHPNMRRSFIVRSQLPPEQLVSSIRTKIHEVDPQQAIASVASMDDLLDKSIALPRLNMAFLAAFAAIALLLACVGIYGVVAWSVAQRVNEIGVRMALGATRSRILLLFMRRAASATAIGIVAGTCAALLLTRLLRTLWSGRRQSASLSHLNSCVAGSRADLYLATGSARCFGQSRGCPARGVV